MILSTVLNFSRVQSQTDSNGLSDTNGIVFANEALLDFHRRLVEKGVDAAQTQESSITGTSGVGIYSYPTSPASIIALKTIELNYANTAQDQYKVATQVDVSNLPNGGFGNLRVNASTSNPHVDDRGNQFEIFPTPTSTDNLTALIKLFGYVQPSVYSSVSDTVLYPENLDAALLGWRVSANYLYSLGGENLSKGDAFNLKYEERVKQYITSLGRGTQQPLQATPIQLTGFEF